MNTEPDTTGARSRRKSDYRDFFDAPWVGSLFRPMLIALVAASLVAGPVALLRVAGTTWQLGYVLPFALLAALEGVYSTLRLGRPNWRDRRGLVFRSWRDHPPPGALSHRGVGLLCRLAQPG